MSSNNFHFNEHQISENLIPFNSPSRRCYTNQNFTKSAILFLIMVEKAKPYDLILMRRTSRKGDKHAGEICFPGGIIDQEKDKTLKHTALRETKEELGVPPENITLLGALNDHITPKFFIITPIVGYIKASQKMIKEEREVEEIINIPINFFANKENYHERTYKLQGNDIAVGKYVFRPSPHKKFTIFGATTHIIVHYIETVYNLRLTAPGHRRICCDDLKHKSKSP